MALHLGEEPMFLSVGVIDVSSTSSDGISGCTRDRTHRSLLHAGA